MNPTLCGDLTALMSAVLKTMPDPFSTAQAEALEQDIARHFGLECAIVVSSGTAALHCALSALDIGPGDEVLVPAVSVVMSVAPVVYAGAHPVFVDSNASGTDFDYEDLTAKVSKRTRAVLAVYLWGRAGDPERLRAFADAHRLRLIEDACQAHGTRFDGRLLGTFGDLGCFSTKDGKILWSGEGGFIVTADHHLAARCRGFRTHWQTAPPHQMACLGYNYRLAEPLAALAKANLGRFDQLVARRREQAHLLTSLLATARGIRVPKFPLKEDWNGYAALARIELPRPRAFSEHLAALAVANSVGTFGLWPTNKRPAFAAYSPAPCPTAATVIDSTLAVAITENDSNERIRYYGKTIIAEARRWANT